MGVLIVVLPDVCHVAGYGLLPTKCRPVCLRFRKKGKRCRLFSGYTEVMSEGQYVPCFFRALRGGLFPGRNLSRSIVVAEKTVLLFFFSLGLH